MIVKSILTAVKIANYQSLNIKIKILPLLLLHAFLEFM